MEKSMKEKIISIMRSKYAFFISFISIICILTIFVVLKVAFGININIVLYRIILLLVLIFIEFFKTIIESRLEVLEKNNLLLVMISRHDFFDMLFCYTLLFVMFEFDNIFVDIVCFLIIFALVIFVNKKIAMFFAKKLK